MKAFKRVFTLILIIAISYESLLTGGALQLVSTESDPDAFIENCVNVINGDYCEAATDLVINGPDPLVLQRFYSSQDCITGETPGGWRILPHRFLVIGKDPSGRTSTVRQEDYDWTKAFVGERSGGILPYCGWRNGNRKTKDPLKLDVLKDAMGLVNTYAGKINGHTNHQNNKLHCQGDTCELTLGDGTRRFYKKFTQLSPLVLGEELLPLMASEVVDPEYFLLVHEILPSGNQIDFSYDSEGHIVLVETKNKSLHKIHSWMKFAYESDGNSFHVKVTTSDDKTLDYLLIQRDDVLKLVKVEGSHSVPVSYTYDGLLLKKSLPDGRFIELEYENQKVKCLKKSHPSTGEPSDAYRFMYGNTWTEVTNAFGVRTCYHFDEKYQLKQLDRYDDQNVLYRIEKKFWGKTKSDAGRLLARTISDGFNTIYSYRSLNYDTQGNTIEERLYGNLTGRDCTPLHISAEGEILKSDEDDCNIKTFEYSTDGFNLLLKTGDVKGNRTVYTYQAGTNLLARKLIYDRVDIKKRTFYYYNEDAVCIKTIDDNGSDEKENQISSNNTTERHIIEFKPREVLPNIGLPEIIEEKAIDLNSRQTLLVKKQVNSYDSQGNLIEIKTYDSNNNFAFSTTSTYNNLGQIASTTDALARTIFYTYDNNGNRVAVSSPWEDKEISTIYDFQNRPVEIIETNTDGHFKTQNKYDLLGRKVSSTDRFGNTTHYEYDVFSRLTQIIHPEVIDDTLSPIHPTFKYSYDIFGNVVKIVDPKGYITTRSYNLRGDPTKITYPDGSYELFKYDPEGSLHRSLTREQLITVYEYDYLGRCIYEECSTPNESGIPSSVTSNSHKYNGFRCNFAKKGNLTKKCKFDPSGKLISIQLGDCFNSQASETRKTEILYDSLGRIQNKKVWFGLGPEDYSLECLEYDLIGNIIENRIEDSKGNILIRKGYAYDLQDRCIEEFSMEGGFKTTLLKTTYNSDDEPILYIDASNRETHIIFDYNHQNILGQTVLRKMIVNPEGMQTQIEFDALGRIYSIIKKDFLGFLLASQTIYYDALGNKSAEVIDQIVDGRVVSSQKNSWKHGPMGRLEEEIRANQSQVEQHTFFTYEALGQLSSQSIQGVDGKIQYFYNKRGLLYKIEAANKRQELQINNHYQYDVAGNIVSAQSFHGLNVERIHNVFNQVVKETVRDGEGSYSLKYNYDRKGRLTEVILPDESKIAYTYDALFGREVNRISKSGEILYTHTYDRYDEQGRLLTENHIGYVGLEEHSYEANGREIARSNKFYNNEFVRDSLDRLIQIKGDNKREYSYNFLSQLTSEKHQILNSFAYDSIDNRIKINNEDLVYNSLNQLISTSEAKFCYDPQGNLLRKTLEGEEIHFEHNILCQLIAINKADQTSVNFSYDPFGRILVEKNVEKKGNSKKTLSTTRYLHIDHQEIGTLKSNNKLQSLKIPGLVGDRLSPLSIAFEFDEQPHAPLHDIIGNVINLIDPESAEIVESYDYTAFGEITIYNSSGTIERKSPSGNPWQFSEKRTNEKTGLILFGLRLYDPSMGRWISQDPAGIVDGPNLYAYLHNNPVNHFDRYGLQTETSNISSFENYFYGEVEKHCHCEKHRTCKRGGDIGKTVSSSLPKITYCEDFEQNYPKYERSKIYDLSDLGLLDLPPDLEIGLVNGIWNDFSGARENTQYASKLAGGYNVHAVYNATHGKIADLKECNKGLDYIATDPVQQLHRMWNSFFERSSPNAFHLMICHSQGALHVRNALLDYPPELRKRILVVAIAPAAYIYEETCAKVIHYRAPGNRDFVPRIDSKGSERAKNSIIDLESHPDAPWFDHEFMSPTFQNVIRKHALNYINSQGTSL